LSTLAADAGMSAFPTSTAERAADRTTESSLILIG
jgi:hypothetical protein